MEHREQHVVIGAGVAGCLTAIMRRRAGYDVILLEQTQAVSSDTHPVCTQGSNIVSENHSGAEYPFDPQSARDCLRGRVENERFFPDIIFGGKTYSRIIASEAMQHAGHDIIGQCRANLDVIQQEYRRLCEQDAVNAVFGPPDEVCSEVGEPLRVDDVGAAFVTPQRGINSAVVSAVLDAELRATAVDVRSGCQVQEITRREDGTFEVRYRDADGGPRSIVADQVSICNAGGAIGLAGRLNPAMAIPTVYMALRQILYVDLPDGTDKDYTCLKLEDRYGGMFSPLNQDCALIYYPPAAHIAVAAVDPLTRAVPPAYQDYRAKHPDELDARATSTLENLRRFYPELDRSSVITPYLKIAVNTVDDSRVRRNAGVWQVKPGCTAMILLKWTMGVPNARRDLELALAHSVQIGTLDPNQVQERLARGTASLWAEPPAWSRDPATCAAQVARHSRNMGLPTAAASPFTPSGSPALSVVV